MFVVVSRQTKKGIPYDLCASAVNNLQSAIICVNLRLNFSVLAPTRLLLAVLALRYALCCLRFVLLPFYLFIYPVTIISWPNLFVSISLIVLLRLIFLIPKPSNISLPSPPMIFGA